MAKKKRSSPPSSSSSSPARRNGRSPATSPAPEASATSTSTAPSMLSGSLRPRAIESPMDLAERGPRGDDATEYGEDMELLDSKGANGNGSAREARFEKGHAKRKSWSRSLSKNPLVEPGRREGSGPGLTGKDRKSFALLVLLYLLQGIPIGITFGTLPFLLKPKLSYSQLALFSLSTYPYSLKLLWSPIVDACFWPSLGRRKSWIIPVQAIIGVAMFWVGSHVNGWLAEEVPSVTFLTSIFVSLIFFAATQDIAVDGWALTLLSQDNLSYASTAQTIGLNTGYFLSFTVFLAFNSVEFGNKYFRSTPLETPLLTLGGYMKFWSYIYVALTLWIWKFQPEDAVSEDDPDMDIKKVYKVMYSIVKLKHIQSFIILHLVSKIGFMANDSVTSLKLLEKGFLKEDMAVAVLIDFPFQIIGGWIAASWSTGSRPLRPWISAFGARLAFGLLSMALVAYFPQTSPIPWTYFILVIGFTVLGSFTSTVQFVGISAFHTQIADPLIGGTYMTLLNTVSNLGGTWPKPIVLQGVDYLSKSVCHIIDKAGDEILVQTTECISEHGKSACSALGGMCVVERDGYYAVSLICVAIGAVLLVGYVIPTAKRLQALPASAWKVSIPQ